MKPIESAPRSSPFQRIGTPTPARTPASIACSAATIVLGVGGRGHRAAGGEHLAGDALARLQPVAEPLVGAVVPGGRERRCRRRRAGTRPRPRRRRRAPASRASVSSTAWSSSETLSACAARASAPVALGLGDAALLGLQPREPERRLVGERLGDQDLVGRPELRGSRRASTATWWTSPSQASGTSSALRASSRVASSAPSSATQRPLVEREACARSPATCAGPGGPGARRRRRQHLDAVGAQRAARLGGERREQLVGGAGGQGRLGEAAQRGVRDVRSDARGGSQGRGSLRPKGLPFGIGPGSGPVLIGDGLSTRPRRAAIRRARRTSRPASRRRRSARRSPRTARPRSRRAAACRWPRGPRARRSPRARRRRRSSSAGGGRGRGSVVVPSSVVRRSSSSVPRRPSASSSVERRSASAPRRRCRCRRRSSRSVGTVSATAGRRAPRRRDTSPPPQPAATRRGDEQEGREGCARRAHADRGQRGSAAMRRPQCGQSLRSFCASWSHQLQKRRFSTDQGSDDVDGGGGQHLADDLHRLARLAVAVRPGPPRRAAAPRGRWTACASGTAGASSSARSLATGGGRPHVDPHRYATRARRVRVLIFHGYLLRGTGSNVYNAALAEAFARNGHEVHLLCQDRAPLELPWVDAAGDWDGGALELRRAPRPAARDRLPAGHRRPAARLRRRPLRGRRGAPVPRT